MHNTHATKKRAPLPNIRQQIAHQIQDPHAGPTSPLRGQFAHHRRDQRAKHLVRILGALALGALFRQADALHHRPFQAGEVDVADDAPPIRLGLIVTGRRCVCGGRLRFSRFSITQPSDRGRPGPFSGDRRWGLLLLCHWLLSIRLIVLRRIGTDQWFRFHYWTLGWRSGGGGGGDGRLRFEVVAGGCRRCHHRYRQRRRFAVASVDRRRESDGCWVRAGRRW